MDHHPPPFRRFASKVFKATTISAEPQPAKPSCKTTGYFSDVTTPADFKTHSPYYDWKAMPRRKPSPTEKDPTLAPQRSIKDTAPLTYEHPSRQKRWSDVPLAFRPSEWLEPHLSSRPTTPDNLHSVKANGPVRQPPKMASPKPRRRPEPLRSVSYGVSESRSPSNATPLVFPTYDPYHDVRNVQSAPFMPSNHQQPRSQPGTPGCYEYTQQHHLGERPASTAPKTTSIQSVGIPHSRSLITATDDSDLEDDEFHLFAEAISGLGPEDAFTDSFQPPALPTNLPTAQGAQLPSQPPVLSYQQYPQQDLAPQASLQIDPPAVSPIIFTPTTRTAIHHIAQMPEAYTGTRIPSRSSSPQPPPRLSISPPRAPSPMTYPNRPPHQDELEIYNVSPIEPVAGADGEDELPDYASSQAQAQEVQRIEAARRAQELQRKWRAGVGY